MATRIGVTVDGTISAGLGTTSSGSCSGPSVSSPGIALQLVLNSEHASADTAVYQPYDSVDSPGSPVSLPIPAGLQGTVFYIRILDDGPLDVSVTHDDQGATIYPVDGMLLIEPSEDEFITAITVQGSAAFEWLLTGDRA